LIGDKINQIRKESGLTTDEFCKKIGISGGGLSNIESSVYAPGTEVIFNIGRAFNIPVRVLAQEEFPMTDEYINEYNISVGKKIKRYRKLNGYTQTELAEKLEYTSPAQISLIESGKRGMSKDKLIKACTLFNLQIADLLLSPDIEEQNAMFIDYSTSEHSDLIKRFILLCQLNKKPIEFIQIKRLIEKVTTYENLIHIVTK